MFFRTTIITSLVALALVCSTAPASLIVYEGFDYGTPGIVGGQTGGAGWLEGWQNASTTTSLSLTSPGLTHPVLPTSGNGAQDTSTGQDRRNHRAWDSDPYVYDGSELWFSFLFNTSTDSTGSELRVYPLGGTGTTPGAGVMIWRNSSINARIGGVNDDSAQSLSYARGTTNLVVGQLTFSDTAGEDSLRVWLNPPVDQAPTAGYIEHTGDFPVFTSGGNPIPYNVYMRGGTNWMGEVDELRIGTSFSSVVPVPNSVLFDFAHTRTSPAEYYNNATGATTTGVKVSDAIDAKGDNTGIDLSVTSRFRESVDNGVVSSAAGFHENAQRDSFYVHHANYSNAAVRLENLSPELLYDVMLFGSRQTVASDRYTVYTIGSMEQVLDTKANTSNVVTFSRVSPNSGGEIDIGVRLLTNADTALLEQLGIGSTNTDHGYLSAMRLTAAGINYTTAGQVVSQNFDSLADSGNNSTHSWSDGMTVPGWYFAQADGTPVSQYRVFDGSAGRQGELLSLGAEGDTDRALGFQTSSASGSVHKGLRLVNTGGLTLDGFRLEYTGEQWREVNASNPSEIVFSYQVFDTGSGSLTEPSGWSEISELTFIAPHYHDGSGTNQPLDGRDPANRMELAGMAMDLTWAPGQELWLRWTDIHPPHQMMGINDVWFRAVPEPGSLLLLLAGVIMVLGLRRRR